MNAIALLLLSPLAGAGLLLGVGNYRRSAKLNIAVSFATLCFALLLLHIRPPPDAYFLADDLNIVFIVLNALVGFTTSVFSASYIGHEIDSGRLSAGYLRLYHAMFQLMMFGMDLALTANNIGLMWVAIELATLTTVMLVGIYRTQGCSTLADGQNRVFLATPES